MRVNPTIENFIKQALWPKAFAPQTMHGLETPRAHSLKPCLE